MSLGFKGTPFREMLSFANPQASGREFRVPAVGGQVREGSFFLNLGVILARIITEIGGTRFWVTCGLHFPLFFWGGLALLGRLPGEASRLATELLVRFAQVQLFPWRELGDVGGTGEGCQKD